MITSPKSRSDIPAHAAVVVVGAGQAGLAVARALLERGERDVVVLEREGVASSWRRRWDSFTLVTPNALVSLPGAPPPSGVADGFMRRDDVIAWLEQYAAPVSALVVRASVERITAIGASDDARVAVHTSAGTITARDVVVATGHGVPFVPSFARDIAPTIGQLHTHAYRSPSALRDGGVLVVGSGQSGVQIAFELLASGRRVVVAAGSCGWVPRRYLGRDILVWAHEIGFYDRRFDELTNGSLARGACQPQLVGNRDVDVLNLAVLAKRGALIVGRVAGIAEPGVLAIEEGLEKSLRFGDEFAKNFISTIDVRARERGIPTTSSGYASLPWQGHLRSGQDVRRLALAEEGIGTVLWATGYRHDTTLVVDIARDDDGYPVHQRGVTAVPGLFFLGLPYQHRRGSALIHGVGEDAAHIADAIVKRGAQQDAA